MIWYVIDRTKSFTSLQMLHRHTHTHKTWNNSIIIPRCLHASDLCCANIPPPHWLAPRSAAPPSARRARRAPRGTAGHHASPWRSWEDSPQPWRSEEAPGPCHGDPEKGPNGVTINTWRWSRVWWYPARINKISRKWNYPNATQVQLGGMNPTHFWSVIGGGSLLGAYYNKKKRNHPKKKTFPHLIPWFPQPQKFPAPAPAPGGPAARPRGWRPIRRAPCRLKRSRRRRASRPPSWWDMVGRWERILGAKNISCTCTPLFPPNVFFPILLGKLGLKVSFNTIFVTGLCHISHILWISIFIFHSELYQTWLRCFTKFPIFLTHLLLPTLSPALPLALVDSGSSTAP